MADALDLGSSGAIRRGSSPLPRTSSNRREYKNFSALRSLLSEPCGFSMEIRSKPLKFAGDHAILPFIGRCRGEAVFHCADPAGLGIFHEIFMVWNAGLLITTFQQTGFKNE